MQSERRRNRGGGNQRSGGNDQTKWSGRALGRRRRKGRMDVTLHLWIWDPASSRISYFCLVRVSDDSLLCPLVHTFHSTQDPLSPEVWSGPQLLIFPLGYLLGIYPLPSGAGGRGDVRLKGEG